MVYKYKIYCNHTNTWVLSDKCICVWRYRFCVTVDLYDFRVDGITIPSRLGKGVLRRTPEVFDCWFESGSMPYAQVHYPFERKKEFDDAFPADFIAEGIDQTRGWYVMQQGKGGGPGWDSICNMKKFLK